MKKIPSRWVRTILGAACALAGWTVTATANDASEQRRMDAPPLTRESAETWFDGFMPYALQRGDIAGAVVVVVRDGEVLLQKGYGVTDIATGTPVDPERTLFRVASISKTFTWTAVMQQVELGKIDLDRDVNEYLDFKIPDAFGKPVTMRNLMTHTPGFEETIKGSVFDASASPAMPIGDYLKAHIPPRIYPPGEVPAYSNYGTTLAGYIVERVSGEPYLDYMDKHVLGALGMTSSTFRQPLPSELQPRLSPGYGLGSGQAQPFEGIAAAPAGSLSATGPDMARFMIAHLQNGRYGEQQLLSPETAQLMHKPTLQAIPPLNGMSLGFFQHDRNGHRIIGHAGDTGLYHSDMQLYLDDGVGLFMSMNSSGADMASFWLRQVLFEQFTDHYFPADMPREPTVATAAEHARVIAGTYEMSRGFATSFMTAPGLFQQMKLAPNADGTLSGTSLIFAGPNNQPRIWREVAPFVWREQGGRERLGADVRDGRVVAVSTDTFAGILVMRPVPGWRSAALNVPLLIGAIVVLALTLIAWPVSAFARGRYSIQRKSAGGAVSERSRTAREVLLQRLTRITAIVDLVFLLGWAFAIAHGSSQRTAFDDGLDPWLRLLQLLGLIGALGAIAAVWHAWIVWSNRASIGARLRSIVVALACVAVTWFAFVFKLITFGLNY